jgi:hypothetical protein
LNALMIHSRTVFIKVVFVAEFRSSLLPKGTCACRSWTFTWARIIWNYFRWAACFYLHCWSRSVVYFSWSYFNWSAWFGLNCYSWFEVFFLLILSRLERWLLFEWLKKVCSLFPPKLWQELLISGLEANKYGKKFW